jgi:manganese efflux pump family protein
MNMAIAALVTWVLTAGGGFVMLGMWLSRGGARRPGATRFPSALIFGHFALAAIGLILWIAALITGSQGVAWTALALALLAAVLGFGMLARWVPARRSAGDEPVEKHFPVPVVIAHGVFAVATVVLVLLAALAVPSVGA